MIGKAFRHRAVDKIKAREGFTLLEMVLATALVSVLFTATAFIIPTWYKAYTKTININYARQISNTVIGTVESQLRFANKVEVIEPTALDPVQRLTGRNKSSRFYIPMKESRNLIDGLVYDEDFFINNDMTLSFSLDGANTYCMVTVTITRDGEKVLSKTRAVPLSGEKN